jgi:membrane-bound lytic murein transglycosylase D
MIKIKPYVFLMAPIFLVAAISLGWNEPRSLSDAENAASANSDEEAQGESTVNETESVEADVPKVEIKQQRPWQPPNYTGQEKALGWTPDIFSIPPKLQTRVNFWKDVYTKYSTNQGLLHDSQLVAVVYGQVDFKEGMSRRERKHLVDNKKKEIRDMLTRLDKADNEFRKTKEMPKLEGEDLRIWNLFAEIDEPHKFKKATERKRLRFQLGQRDRFIEGIYYSGRYLPEMERVFSEAGLPRELTRLPFVESSFNVKARSRVGASGIWQFMRYTGRRFLRIHYLTDERNDPIRATEAAARLLRLNFEMLNKWGLAVTGWNHGPVGVQRMIKKFETDDITDLVDDRRGRFGFASANFYTCFLAAVEVEKDAVKYFGPVYWDSPLDAKEIKLTKPLSHKMLEKWFADDKEKAKDLNPHIQKAFWLGYGQVGAKDFVRVPADKYDVAVKDIESAPVMVARTSKKPSKGATGEIAKNSEGPDEAGLQYYLIGPGETLSEIATQLGVTIGALKELNGIDNPRSIRAGQKILVPQSKN